MRSKSAVVEEFRIHTIQEAALRVISRHGVEGASMQAVAAEAGIAKGTIYLYFENRDDMVARTASWAISQLTKRLEPLLAEANRLSFADRLRQIIETKIEFFHAHREFFRLYREVSSSDKETSGACARNRTVYEEYLKSFAALLQRAMKRGEVHRADPDRLALYIAEGVHAVVIRRLSESKSPPPAQEAEWMVEMILRGIAKKGAGA
jgi:AcrR family transcriptional regulator